MSKRKLPIGVQDFYKIREDEYIYVDKTAYIYSIVHDGSQYFLSRPRRFGKSLLLSTFRAYFEGRKDLFNGLEIEELEKDNPNAWEECPIFYFDFNKADFSRENALEDILDAHLRRWEEKYGSDGKDRSLEVRFQHLLVAANEKTGKRAVVLVDEYDKPLLEAFSGPELETHNKQLFKGFFSALKSYDAYLEFVFITGVTKFTKVSIFSDLNQLNDISLDKRYASLCGITEGELKTDFDDRIRELAAENDLTYEECLAELRKNYDGYHFHQDAAGVYNPFSILNAFDKNEFGAYWFSTGTPTFLIEKIKTSGFDAKEITEGNVYADAAAISDYRAENPDPIPLFYQTGYLTINGYDKKYRSYALGYPNEEVKYGFLKSLAPTYLNREDEINPLNLRAFGKDLEKADTDSLRDRFIALFAGLPYTTDEKPVEQNFQNVVYIVFTLLGEFVHTEVHSARGRADVIVETKDYVYIFEFKRDKSAKEALEQIEEKGYADRYAADPRHIIKIGANFDSEKRALMEWEVE